MFVVFRDKRVCVCFFFVLYGSWYSSLPARFGRVTTWRWKIVLYAAIPVVRDRGREATPIGPRHGNSWR